MSLDVAIEIGGETAAEMKKAGHHTELQPRVNRFGRAYRRWREL